MKKYLVLTAVLVLVLGFSFQIVSAQNGEVDQELLKQAIEFREMHGFDNSVEFNTEMLKMPVTSNLGKVFGFHITKEEIDTLAFREKVLDAVPDFRKVLLEKYPDMFGGIHYDGRTGQIIVKLTTEDIETYNAIQKLFAFPENVTFELADFTYNELEKVQESFLKDVQLLKDLSINNFYISENKNRIVVNAKEGQEINKTEFGKYYDLEYIEFDNQVYKLYNKDVDLGKYILGYMSAIKTYSYCSSGFFGQDSAGYAVLVTAGHCDIQSFTNYWYNGKHSSSYYIGAYTYKVTSDSGETQYSDAGYIRVTSDTNMISSIKTSTSTIPLKYVNDRDEISGEYIYRKGYKSGIGSGKYGGGVCILDYHEDPDVDGYVCDLAILDNLKSANGDSGGTMFKINSSSEATLFGILTGGLDRDGDDIKDATVYSRIKYVASELGLRAIFVSD